MLLPVCIASFITKNKFERYVLRGVVLANIVIGIWLFRLFIFHSNTVPYPVFEGEQSLLSKHLAVFLESKNAKYIKNDDIYTIQIMYYSFIYSIPIKDKN